MGLDIGGIVGAPLGATAEVYEMNACWRLWHVAVRKPVTTVPWMLKVGCSPELEGGYWNLLETAVPRQIARRLGSDQD